jgi:two-component system, chemotaxis family, response regulator Rcp1
MAPRFYYAGPVKIRGLALKKRSLFLERILPVQETPMQKPFRILLVEDNPADADLVQEALVEAKMPGELKTVPDGAQALLYLRGAAPYAADPLPNLVLLDLNLPRVSGFQVLVQMKDDAALRQIPVVILSSSTDNSDVRKAYELHANCYVSKPTDLAEFFAAMRRLQKFWIGTVILPQAERGNTKT